MIGPLSWSQQLRNWKFCCGAIRSERRLKFLISLQRIVARFSMQFPSCRSNRVFSPIIDRNSLGTNCWTMTLRLSYAKGVPAG